MEMALKEVGTKIKISELQLEAQLKKVRPPDSHASMPP